MTLEALAAAAMAALLTHGAASGAASAADIKVIRAGGIGPVATALAGEFERASGHKLIFTFVSGPVVQREIDKGARFDVAITQPDAIERLIKSGKIAAASRADIKQTLLKAKSIAHSKEGASGVFHGPARPPRHRRAGVDPLPHRARRGRGDQGEGHGAARPLTARITDFDPDHARRAGARSNRDGYRGACPTVPPSAPRGTSVKNSVGSVRSRPFTV